MKTKWSRKPPTKKEIQDSFNGFFWIRYCIVDQVKDISGTWPALYKIEPVQVFWTMSSPPRKGKIVDRALIHVFDKTFFLDNKKDMKRFTWQPMVPPLDIQKDDC